ncbi:MAG: biotin--[acetyl-CoA-carboxylase] ligase [Pseudomonadota bacterium]
MSAHVDAVGSTNAELALFFSAKGAAANRHWVTAGEQTLGRARRERNWVSPPGNLYASLCLDVTGVPDENLAIMPLAIGTAVQKCVAALTSGNTHLKWPNDVLIDNAKCCGLLLERHVHAASGASGLIVGIGLNVVSHPADTPYPATHLKEHGYTGDLVTVFYNLAINADEVVRDLGSPGFVSKVRRQWISAAKGIGGPIAVHLANETMSGIFDTLDDQGRLQLRLADGAIKTITAGDVFFN